MTLLCPHCGRECEDHYAFCPACGKKIDTSFLCSHCQNPYLISQTYCVRCGNLLYTPEKEKRAHDKWKLFPVSIILYLTILVVHLVFLLIFREGMTKNMMFVSIFDAVMIIVWACFPAYKTREIFKLKYAFKWWHIPAFFGGVIAGFFIAMGFMKLLQTWLELPSQSMVLKLKEAGYSMTGIILMVCVQPAIIEELAFRGIVYRALERALPVRETILISAFLFAMLHLSLIAMPHLMLLGIFFGYLRYKTGSIYPVMIAHFLHNFGAVMVDRYSLF